jgi:hypothetical protein
MKTQRIAGILAAGLAVASIGWLAAPAFAQKPFLAAAAEHFTLAQAIKNCKLCHGLTKGPSKDNLNDYGKAIQSDEDMKPLLNRKGGQYTADELKVLIKVMEKLADKDSDGDGATNGEEIALGFAPGDPKSTPPAADLEKYRKEHPKDKPKADAPKK